MHLNLIKPHNIINEHTTHDIFNEMVKYFSKKIKISIFNDDIDFDINEKYFLIIPLQGQISPKISNKIEILSKSIIQKIQSGYDIKIYYCTEAECEFEDIFEKINLYCKDNKIPPSIFTLSSGNSKLENLNRYDVGLIREYNPLVHRMSRTLNLKKDKDSVEWVKHKKYLFQCFNNMMKPHRVAILTLLKSNDLLKYIDWSAMRTYDLFKHNEMGFHFIRDYFNLSKLKFEMNDFTFIVNGGNSKYSEYETESIRNPNAEGEPDHNLTYLDNPHKNAYINIVNESQFDLDNTIHITEKSLVPFHFNQLPIFVATKGHVKKLKELYGFDVFDDLINHSYDDIDSHEDRLNAILDEIKRLNNNKNNIIQFYMNNKHRFDTNREIIHKLSNIYEYQVIIDDILK